MRKELWWKREISSRFIISLPWRLLIGSEWAWVLTVRYWGAFGARSVVPPWSCWASAWPKLSRRPHCRANIEISGLSLSNLALSWNPDPITSYFLRFSQTTPLCPLSEGKKSSYQERSKIVNRTKPRTNQLIGILVGRFEF